MPPRLGHDDVPPGGDHAPIASAYSTPNNQQLSIPRILLIFAGLFILKNVVFHDYRSEEIGILKGFGQTEEQIQALIPNTASERRQRQTDSVNEFEQMKIDIEMLKEEVTKLRGGAVIQGKDVEKEVDKWSETTK